MEHARFVWNNACLIYQLPDTDGCRSKGLWNESSFERAKSPNTNFFRERMFFGTFCDQEAVPYWYRKLMDEQPMPPGGPASEKCCGRCLGSRGENRWCNLVCLFLWLLMLTKGAGRFPHLETITWFDRVVSQRKMEQSIVCFCCTGN